ncbi:M23 family metallopeptidase [Dehalobacter sp. DCM]|uniref:M23 family metallopeptidase n=1 Tax=Dehalobacter sp. DCM TaxID=2907827 RepID=UPI003081FD7A|nr:M23 family metallopeptidase [Dehalobacter sp. DCM]
MSLMQKDVLRACGVTEDELNTITKREIGDILLFGNVVKPEYLVPYVATKEEVKESIDKTEKARQEQKLRFEQNGLTLDDLDLMSEDYLFEEIAKMPIPKIQKIIKDARSSLKTNDGDFTLQYITPNLYTKFNKNDIGAYESTTYLYFQRYSMNTSYASVATSAHISEVSDYVSVAYGIGKRLFGVTSLTSQQYAGNLFGELTEGSSSSTNKVHEGIDLIRYEGAPVYNLIDGDVINVASELGGTTVSVYQPFYGSSGVSLIYMHLKNVNVVEGQYIYNFTSSFAQEGRYISGSENNTHVHVEVRNGQAEYGNSGTGETLSSASPYLTLLYLSAQ